MKTPRVHSTPMPPHPHRYPVRCASCEYLFYPDATADYLCDICQRSLEDYVRSMDGDANPTIRWWQRQQDLRRGLRSRGAQARAEDPVRT